MIQSWIVSGAWMKWVSWAILSLPITALFVVSWFSTAFLFWIPYLIVSYVCVPVFVFSAISLNLMREGTNIQAEWDRNYH